MSARLRVIAILLGVGALAPGAALAAEGMPQLNFSNPLTLGQAFWMIVIFLVLYVLLKSWALPQVAQVVEARAATIAGDLQTAQAAKEAADAAVAELNAVTRQAHAEGQAEIARQVAAAKAAAAARALEADRALDERLAQAEAQIHAARTAAMGALTQVANDTAHSIVERMIGARPAADMVGGAVSHAMAARGL
jgi:F-type H+-transporting ATPase subunit b